MINSKFFSRIIFAMTAGLIALPAMAADNVYFCSEDAVTGFAFNQQQKKYVRANFKEDKFRIALIGSKLILDDPLTGMKVDFECQSTVRNANALMCPSGTMSINFNIATGGFILSRTFGNISLNSLALEGDTITVSIGTCSKF